MLRIWIQKEIGRSPCWSPNSTHLYLEIHLLLVLLCNYTICMYKFNFTLLKRVLVEMAVGGLWKLRIVDDKPCLPVLQESNFLINGRSYILWFNYGVSARISTKTGANQTILQIIEIGYFLGIFSFYQIKMLPYLNSFQYFSYTKITGIYGRNVKGPL